jgi:hypothetical protein
MGVTSIRSGRDLLGRAGEVYDQMALIPEPLIKCLYLDGHPSTAEELELYDHLLLSPVSERGRWLQINKLTGTGPTTSSNAPEALRIPVARLTQALRIEEESLTFFAVVQGLPGAHIVKVVRRDSCQGIANPIFHVL